MFFFLNIEGWKVAAEQQLEALELEVLKQVVDEMRSGCRGLKGLDLVGLKYLYTYLLVYLR